MKSLVLTLSIGCLLCLSIQAQTSFWGILGGAGVAPAAGFRGGVSFEFPTNRFISLQPELGISMRYNREVIRKLAEKIDYGEVMLAYVELPVAAKFRLAFRKTSLFALVGGQANYGLAIWANYKAGEEVYRGWQSFDELRVKSWDFGFYLGGGIEQQIGRNRRMFIDFRRYIGISNLDPEPGYDIFNENSFLVMGLLFPL